MLVAHLARCEREIRNLQQQEAGNEILAEPVIADDTGTERRYCSRNQSNRGKSARQGVIKQGYVQGRKDGEQQYFRNRQIAERAVQAQIGNAELQHAGYQHTQFQPSWHASPTGKRQEYQHCQ